MTAEDQQESLQVAALKEIRETNWTFRKEIFLHHAKTIKMQYDCYIDAGWDAPTALYFITNGVK